MLIDNCCISVLRTLILPYVGDDELLAKLGAGVYIAWTKSCACANRENIHKFIFHFI